MLGVCAYAWQGNGEGISGKQNLEEEGREAAKKKHISIIRTTQMALGAWDFGA